MLDNLNSGQIDAANSIIINDVSKVYTKVKSSLSDKNRTWRVMIDALLNVNPVSYTHLTLPTTPYV